MSRYVNESLSERSRVNHKGIQREREKERERERETKERKRKREREREREKQRALGRHDR